MGRASGWISMPSSIRNGLWLTWWNSVTMLRQRRQDQRQARWPRVVLQDRTVDGAEEAFCVDVHLRLLPTVAMVHGRVRPADAAVRGDGLVRLGQFLSQRLGNRPRDT